MGHRPTFGGGDLLVEAFIIDFGSDIYGEQITVDLIERMGADVETTKEILESTSANVG